MQQTLTHRMVPPPSHLHETVSPDAVKVAWIILACTLAWGISMYALWLGYDIAHNPVAWVPRTLLTIGFVTGNALVYLVTHRHHVYAEGYPPYGSLVPPLAATNAIYLTLILTLALSHPTLVAMLAR